MYGPRRSNTSDSRCGVFCFLFHSDALFSQSSDLDSFSADCLRSSGHHSSSIRIRDWKTSSLKLATRCWAITTCFLDLYFSCLFMYLCNHYLKDYQCTLYTTSTFCVPAHHAKEGGFKVACSLYHWCDFITLEDSAVCDSSQTPSVLDPLPPKISNLDRFIMPSPSAKRIVMVLGGLINTFDTPWRKSSRRKSSKGCKLESAIIFQQYRRSREQIQTSELTAKS